MANTVKVRIAVVVGPDGSWTAYGSKDSTPQGAVGYAMMEGDETVPKAIHWIFQDLPIPEIQTIQAKVSDAPS